MTPQELMKNLPKIQHRRNQPSQSALDGLDPLTSEGILFLDGDVCPENINPLVRQLIYLRSLDERDQPEVIYLYINSDGGSGSDMFYLIDTIRTMPQPVATIGMGFVASAGLIILMSGTKGFRFASRNSVLMSHQYATGMMGKEHELAAAAKLLEIESEFQMRVYKRCTKKSETYIRKHLLSPSDLYMTAEEAEKHGIIDGVIDF